MRSARRCICARELEMLAQFFASQAMPILAGFFWIAKNLRYKSMRSWPKQRCWVALNAQFSSEVHSPIANSNYCCRLDRV